MTPSAPTEAEEDLNLLQPLAVPVSAFKKVGVIAIEGLYPLYAA